MHWGQPTIEGASPGTGTLVPVSFYATKNLTCGEGGALATDNPDSAAFARTYRLHGLSTRSWNRYTVGGSVDYDLLGPGIKANLPDLLATPGSVSPPAIRPTAGSQASHRIPLSLQSPGQCGGGH